MMTEARGSTRVSVLAAACAAMLLFILVGCRQGSTAPPEKEGTGQPGTATEDRTLKMNDTSLQFAEFRGDAEDLARRVDGYLEGAPQETLPESPAALVVPHAGYVYSGPVAAYAYRAVAGKEYDTVVIVGPSHRVRFKGISVVRAEVFETPLGTIPMDTGLIDELIDSSPAISYHPEAHAREHSVEVQLPFVQRSLQGFSLVMAVIGTHDIGAERAFVDTLAASGRKILLLASSDFSHYHDYESARELDSRALEFIRKMDGDGLLSAAMAQRCELCGVLPVHLVIEYARKTGHDKVRLLHAASSGDTAGPKDQVVGYASLAFLPGGDEAGTGGDDLLGKAEKERLLAIARETITEYVTHRRVPEFHDEDPILCQERGAFVTIKQDGRLRGCIGNFHPTDPLYKTVTEMAVAASSQDPRFPPMSPGELAGMELEISVLTPLRKTEDTGEIEVGRHGIYIIKGRRRGVLLPQVATENGWDRLTFLQQTCRKAGLSRDDWKEGAEIYLFEAQIFGEGEETD